MNENIFDFYKNKTKNEQDELTQPYMKIMDSKMVRAKEISDKIILNKEQVVSLWKKIINDFEYNNNEEVFIKNITYFLSLYAVCLNTQYFLYEYLYIQDLIDNVKDKKKVKEYINKIDSLIEYEHVFVNESQRSKLEAKFYKGNNLVLEELKELKKIVSFEDFKEIFFNGFDIDADELNNMLKKYITNNEQTVLQKNIKELYEAL